MRIGFELSKCLVVGVCLASMGCGSSDSNPSAAAGGASGVGGNSSAGGSTTKSSSTGGATGNFWPSAFSSTGTASTPYHTTTPAGNVSCLTCHGPASTPALATTTKLVFGGTVYKADGTTGAPNVQVGVSDGTKKFYVYTAPNGYYWQEGTDTVNWPSADIRTRTANGESIKKTTDARNADCDSCHSGTPTVTTTATVLKAP